MSLAFNTTILLPLIDTRSTQLLIGTYALLGIDSVIFTIVFRLSIILLLNPYFLLELFELLTELLNLCS